MCLIIIKNLKRNCIKMNESMSIFLATTILALGGFGLYMFKSSDENEVNVEEGVNEKGFFSSSFFDWTKDDDKKDNEQEDLEEDEEEEVKPRRRAAKTQKNRKSTGQSKRRYY